MKLKRWIPLFSMMLIVLFCSIGRTDTPSPPGQPLFGPGGSNYDHAGLVVNGPFYADGPGDKDNYEYYIYEPDNPMPDEAPVVLFLHGWLAYKPEIYMGWLEHIVRKGYIVVWVRYDAGLTFPASFAEKAMITWKDALLRIYFWGGRNHVLPSRHTDETLTAVVGHSAGGYLSAILAANAAEQNSEVPIPKAVVAIEPGGEKIIPEGNFSLIPTETKLLIVLGDQDRTVCESTGVYLWQACDQIADDDKDLLVVRSDQYGLPKQIADHKFPATEGFRAGIDARDYFVTFKLAVAALNCTFNGRDCEVAFGNGSFGQIYMGRWSDGTPMIPMDWVDDPSSLEMTCMDH